MNENKRLTEGMDLEQILITMSEGNPGALTSMMELIDYDLDSGLKDIELFDSLEIYGPHIYMVWNDCCNREVVSFKATIQAFREGKFSKEEIHENLSNVRAKPFI